MEIIDIRKVDHQASETLSWNMPREALRLHHRIRDHAVCTAMASLFDAEVLQSNNAWLPPSQTIVLVRPDQYLDTVNSPSLRSRTLKRYNVVIAESWHMKTPQCHIVKMTKRGAETAAATGPGVEDFSHFRIDSYEVV